MRFYGVTDRETLKMPVTRFWMMHKNIDRIAAEESVRFLNISASSQSADGYKSLLDSMHEQMGDVVIYDIEYTDVTGKVAHPRMAEELDRGGLSVLKALSGQRVGEYFVKD